jgi:hypothetical protein
LALARAAHGSAGSQSCGHFKPVIVPAFNVPIYPDLAAFTAALPHEATQDVASECLDHSWFANKTLFLVRQDNFGFSIPAGSIAIAENHACEGKDHDLVIVRQKGHFLARRLLRPPKGGELALAAQARTAKHLDSGRGGAPTPGHSLCGVNTEGTIGRPAVLVKH